MTKGQRIALAIMIVLFDFITIGLPFGAIFLAYVIIARPKWFSDFIKGG